MALAAIIATLLCGGPSPLQAADLQADLERARGLVQELLGSHDLVPVVEALRQVEADIAAGRQERAQETLAQALRELSAIKRGEPSELRCRMALDRIEKLVRAHTALGHDLTKFHAAGEAIVPAVAAKDWRAAWTAIERAVREIHALNQGNRQDPTRINTDGFEAEPTVTGDGRALYFQYSPRYLFKSRTPRQGPDRPGLTYADTEPDNDRIGVRTFRSTWDGKRWGPPQVQAFPNEARDSERPVFGCVVIGIAPDDRRASLIEYRTRGKHGDVALADRGPDGRWGAYRLWERVNTEHTNEDGHFDLVPGSRRVYFLSDRPGGRGGADIYYAEDDSIFHLNEPTNTADGEWFPQPDAFGNLYFSRDVIHVTTAAGEDHPLELGGRALLPAMAPAITRDGSLLFYRMPVRVLDVALDADSDIFFSFRTGPEPWAWSRPYPVEQRTRAHEEQGLVHATTYALARVVSTINIHPDLACAAKARELAQKAKRLLQRNDAASAFQEAFRAWSLIATEAPRQVLLGGREVSSAGPQPLPRQGGRLLPPERGAYVGTWSQDNSPDMQSLRLFQSQCGVRVKIDHLDVPMQRTDGTLQRLDEPVRLTAGAPASYASPLALMTARAQAGIVTALQIHVPDGNTDAAYRQAYRIASAEQKTRYGFREVIPDDLRVRVQDILDGRLDAYFLAAARTLKKFGRPVMVEFLNEFDADFFAQSFGADGRKHALDVLNGPGTWARLRAFMETHHRPPDGPAELGLTAPLRKDGVELRTAYGDPGVLDGQERVRDAWRHVHDLFDQVGVPNVTWYNHAAGDRAERAESSVPQPLAAYWPGDHYVDWAGTSSYFKDPSLGPTRGDDVTLGRSVLPWYREIETSAWRGTPLILHEMSQLFLGQENVYVGKHELAAWVATVFARRLPEDLPRVKAFFLIYNNFGPLETWSQAEVSAFREHVGQNPYYASPLRFRDDRVPPGDITDLAARVAAGRVILSWTAPGDDGAAGTASRYVLKYRRQGIDKASPVRRDFAREPWKLWSDLGTVELPGLPAPALAGTRQGMVIEGLARGAYWFALQSVDDVPYNSRISNVVEVQIP